MCEEAKRLGRLGDTDDYETRKAKALGIIAGGRAPSTWPGTDGRGHPSTGATNLYVHVSLADLATHLGGTRPSVRSRSSAPPPSTSSAPG